MKKPISLFIFLTVSLFTFASFAEGVSPPVFSANGFICGKHGSTVTCKGPIPGKKDTVTGTGHDIIYLTVNTVTDGKPTRFTYFSDTGCLIGYSFNAAGTPLMAVARHRNGAEKTFEFGPGKYDAVIDYCAGPAPVAAKTTAPGKPKTSTQ